MAASNRLEGLPTTVPDIKACYPCMSSWAYNYSPSADIKPTFGCFFEGDSSVCGTDDAKQGCRSSGKICQPTPALLRGDSILFGAIFELVGDKAFERLDRHEEDRLEISKILGALTMAFVSLVETHRTEFCIDGVPEDNVGALAAYRSTVMAREAAMRSSFAPLQYGATPRVKAAFDMACTLRLKDYDRGYTAWVAALREALQRIYMTLYFDWFDTRARIEAYIKPYGMTLGYLREQGNASF
ncbi:hypothetical protein PG985_001492 [Apiospora marii]|uniref:Glycolipid transfer protein domain-containing protein n=1 Tax=Apiospora marii TaxID=335849 RepID=A0ABR1RJ24_9PEZI